MLSLAAPSTLRLHHADSAACLWQVELTDRPVALAPDPFVPSRLAMVTDDALLLVTDLSLARVRAA